MGSFFLTILGVVVIGGGLIYWLIRRILSVWDGSLYESRKGNSQRGGI